MRSFLLKWFARLINLVRIAIFIFVLLLLIGFISQFIPKINNYPTLVKVNNIEQNLSSPLTEQIKLAMPYKYEDTDFSRLILLVLMLFIARFCEMVSSKFMLFSRKIKEKTAYYDWRNRMSQLIPKEKFVEIDRKFQDLSTQQPADRKKLLKEFAALKSKLDSMGQQLAFLSIDVVDSTGMKRDEDKYLAAYDFDRYNDLVISSLKKFGVVKYAMTPDGMMSCFRTVDDAVQAALTLLDKIENFNRHEKKIKRDFHIRSGIHAGFVYFDEEMPLEQISDRVIDIAGHLQKFAKPDSINIAATAIEPLKNRGGFNESTDVIDEQKVYQWVVKA